jgi:hypothetical protein
MLAITYTKIRKIKGAEWGTPKIKILKKIMFSIHKVIIRTPYAPVRLECCTPLFS